MAEIPPYAAYLLPETVTPTEYAIELYLDFDGSKFHGSEDVSVRVLPSAAIVSEDSSVNYSVTLHALELVISTNATLTLAGTKLPCSRVVIDELRQEATLLFPAPAVRPHNSQNATLHIEFAGELVEALAGLYKSPYKRADGSSAWAAVTQFQATDARRCFPCWDEPDKKAVFRLKVNTPAHMTAISNNVVENTAVVSEGARKVWTFAPSPKMSSYLVGLFVAEYDTVSAKTKHGIDVSVLTPPGRGREGRFALDVGVKCLDFFTDAFKVPYPLPKCDLISVEELSAGGKTTSFIRCIHYLGGNLHDCAAMENWGCVSFRAALLLVDDQTSMLVKQRVAQVVCHELSHQWFGDLVSVKWWSWLGNNESWANFMEYLATDHIFPEWNVFANFNRTVCPDGYGMASQSHTHPIQMDVKDPAEISEIFDAVTYDTGSMSVRTLYNFVGADKFFEGLRVYFQRYAYESTTTKELWLVFEEVTGLPITDVMRNFVLRNGYPYVYAEVESASTPTLVALESKRFTYPWSHNASAWPDTLSAEDAADFRDAARTGFAAACRLSTSLNAGWTPSVDDTDDWNVPLSVLYADGAGAQHAVIATTIILDEATPSHAPESRGKVLANAVAKIASSIPADAQWVKLNSGQSMLYRVLYGPHFLAHVLLHFHEFPKADRVGLVDDVAAAAAGGMIACDSFFQLAFAIKDEPAYDVWHRIVYWLVRAYSLISAGEDRAYTEALAKFIQLVLREQIRRLGWHALPVESTDAALLRGLLLGAAIKVGDADAVANALQEFNAYADSGVLLDPELKSTIYLAAARFGGEEAFEKLLKLYRATDNAEEQRKLLQAIGGPSTPELLKRALAWSLTPEVKNSEVDTVIASASEATWANGPRLTWEFTCEQWPEMLRRFGQGTFLLPYLVDAMCSSSFSSRETFAEVERFFKTHDHPGAERRVSLTLEEIRDRAWRREVLVQAKEKVLEKLAS